MGKRTALYDQHIAAGGKIVDFGGWDMPIHYGSQIAEHQQVRTDAGMFDVSHMTIVDVRGPDATAYLQYLLANDVAKLQQSGKALYSAMLNADGGVIDDLIVYKTDGGYRTVVNCATREKDLEWMASNSCDFDISLTERPELAMLAVQGPKAIEYVTQVCQEAEELLSSLAVFVGKPHRDWFYARTGYTGEDGLEIMVPEAEVASFWDALLKVGVKPAGLGARDTLRLEAGMNLYGSDMDDGVSPLAAGMGWTLAMQDDRNFIGRPALEKAHIENTMQQVGLVMNQRGVMRSHQKVTTVEGGEGEITSGTFSPSLQTSIAIARIPKTEADSCIVDMRGKPVSVRIVKLPFVRHGQSLID